MALAWRVGFIDLQTPSARWLRWLTPGLYIKRWIITLALSILIVDLGLAYALKRVYEVARLPPVFYYLTLQFLKTPTLDVRPVIFGVVGLGLFWFGLWGLRRSVIGPFLPGGDQSMGDILYAFRTRSRGARIVAIGGGTGLSTLLRGLKEYTSNLSAILTVADDGGSSGRLRDEYRILPPGDFRQCLVALADAEPLVKQLFNHRFKEGSLSGHSFGNLFIMAMADITGNFENALRESGRVLAVRGAIIPSTLQDVTLVASVNGHTIEGESKIPLELAPISRVWLKQEAEINPEAVLALMEAEVIIIGPGSLYTSILPNLMVKGMTEAIKASPAIKVFVCNVASQHGETDGFSVSDYLRVVEQHVGGNLFDFAIVNSNYSHTPTGGQSKVIFDQGASSNREVRFILADVVNSKVPSHHDPLKLTRILMKKVWQA
jgi:uncharacterized cofD-like protein